MKKAVMYGAGNIGRGFIGQLFSKSGYEVVFIDVNPVLIEKLNQDREYPVRIVSEDETREETVRGVRAVNGSHPEEVAKEIMDADIMATAVGVNILPRIAGNIAKGLIARWNSGNNKPFDIIICENMLHADKFLAEIIKKELNEEAAARFDKLVGLVEASIGRMVPVMTEEMTMGNPLRVWVEPYDRLPVDSSAFKGLIPEIVNLVPYAPFDFYIRRKLFMHNMAHATSAYLGAIEGVEFIYEAVSIPAVRYIAFRALAESALSLHLEHGFPIVDLISHAEDLIYRFGNRQLGDTVERVGKDTVRKLSLNDRFAGALRMCLKHGINPVFICAGMAAGFLFFPEGDSSSREVTIFAKENGIRAALTKYSEFAPDEFPYVQTMISDFYDIFVKEGLKDNFLVFADTYKKRGQS